MSVREDLGDHVAVTSSFKNETGIDSGLGSNVDGPSIDRKNYDFPRSAVFYADFGGELSSSSDDLTFTLQDSADNSSWSDTGDSINVTDQKERAEVDVDLSGKRQYIRLQLDVSDGSQSLGQNVSGSIKAVLGGSKKLPQ